MDNTPYRKSNFPLENGFITEALLVKVQCRFEEGAYEDKPLTKVVLLWEDGTSSAVWVPATQFHLHVEAGETYTIELLALDAEERQFSGFIMCGWMTGCFNSEDEAATY